jgi:pyruvate dehydrogenase E2 component (dihydrolipoamide acetyltransferase)
MANEFTLPSLGEGVKAGDVLTVLVKAGDTVAKDQAVLELETDKATVEVPSSVDGTIEEMKVAEGDTVAVGQVIFTFAAGSGDGAAAAPAAPVDAAPASGADVERASTEAVNDQDEGLGGDAAPPPSSGDEAIPASGDQGGGGRIEVTLPSLGEGVKSADVLSVLVKVGDAVAKDQGILELETDKATVEVPSPAAGTVAEVRVKDGDQVSTGSVVLVLEGGASQAAPAAKTAPAGKAAPAATPAAAASAQPSKQAAPAASDAKAAAPLAPETRAAQVAAGAGSGAVAPPRPNVPAAPSVRRLARELGLDIGDVKGSGPGGRISQADVMAHAKSVITQAGAAPAGGGAGFAYEPLPDFSQYGAVERKAMRGIRRKTAEHMVASWHTIPHVTQCEKADITDLEALRKQYGPRVEKQGGGKLTVTAIAVKIVAIALRKFPHINVSVDLANEEIIHKSYVNIGLAVDTDRGLLVPVIRDADTKSISEIAAEIGVLAEKARKGKLSLDEMSGGCFTITNLGGIGGTYFTPIVNHPEVAILGMSRSAMEPVWRDGEFEPRLMLPLSLSYDHRVVDGADAMRFLRFVADALEQPFVLSL